MIDITEELVDLADRSKGMSLFRIKEELGKIDSIIDKLIESNIAEDLDFEIDLEWWLLAWGEEPHPAKDMYGSGGGFRDYSRQEILLLNQKLKSLDGTIVKKTHVFRFLGRIPYKGKGLQNLFKCERIPVP